ncbi:MAG: AAA-like domain-containing protein [Cyanobacteria bacterium REEB417]|nr:AAA-like domain-containing protein [Cyanobacteria bacterium REEB417]
MRIFISYKRGVSPDEPLALELHQQLSANHSVFIDQAMTVGTPWAERIDRELRQADVLLLLLSAASVGSEMVAGEVETAQRLQKHQGRPRILPVRVAYREMLPYPLSAYLNPINWALWDCPADTPRLLAELERAMAGEELGGAEEPIGASTDTPKAISIPAPATTPPLQEFQPPSPQAPLEPAEGTMAAESRFYIERDGDAVVRRALERQGVTITIKGPRQMGKSSLLMRVIQQALEAGREVAYLDFQQFDQQVLADADRFYPQFCQTVADQLGLPDGTAAAWAGGGGNNQLATRYVQNEVLKPLNRPLLLAMDEVDRLFEAEYRSDFFSMLRGWHNNRASPLPPLKPWKQLDLALVTATEPYHLIANLNQSPFNVGEVIQLDDFSPAQVADLHQRHGAPLAPTALDKLMELLHGHPYLVRRALYLVASGQRTGEGVLQQAANDDGPFGDHLRYHLFRIVDHQALRAGFRQVIRNHRCDDEKARRLLVAAGLARLQDGAVRPRCPLYAAYFGNHLDG